MVRKFAVEEALDLICGPRMEYYGPPNENLEDIAASWTPYARRVLEQKGRFDGTDVCMMMVILKAVRQVRGYHRDSVVDIGGYAELAEVLNDGEAFEAFVLRAASKIDDLEERGRFIAKFLNKKEEDE